MGAPSASPPHPAAPTAVAPSGSTTALAHPPTAASSCAPPGTAAVPRLRASDLQAGPAPQPLSRAPGVWLADESSALLSATPDAAWAAGPITLGSDSSVTRPVVVARLPKALRGWLGRSVKILGVSGLVCETRLQRFLIRAQVTPDLRTAEHWEGCADGPAIPPAAIADEIWRLSSSGAGRTLIAEFATPCKGALLAIDPDLPTPAIAAAQPASPGAGQVALSAFRELPAYAEVQARYHAERPQAEGAWDDHDARRTISVLELPGQGKPLLFVSVEVGTGCGGFSASLSAIWQSDAPGVPGTVITAIDDRALAPTAIAALSDDEPTILLGPDGRFKAHSVLRPLSTSSAALARQTRHAAGYARVFLSSVPFFRGPC